MKWRININQLKKQFIVTTGVAVVAGLALNVVTQPADAAAKKYTVTVKYVGDDKKTLKTVKATVNANAKYSLVKLATKDKAVHNYTYKYSQLALLIGTKSAR